MRLNNDQRTKCRAVAGLIKGPLMKLQRAVELYGQAMSSFELDDDAELYLILQAESLVGLASGTLLQDYEDVKRYVGDVVGEIVPRNLLDELREDILSVKNMIAERKNPVDVHMKVTEITTKWLIRYCDVYRRCAELMEKS